MPVPGRVFAMDSTLKQRLVGATVLAALAVIFLPMLLQGPDVKQPEAAEVSIEMPTAPGQKFETREIPLSVPDASTGKGGVLGMPEMAHSTDAAGDELAPETALDTPAGVVLPTTAPATSPASNGAAVAAGNYVVSIGSFSNLDNANTLIERLRAQKLPVIADRVQVDGKASMRLRVGPYADRATAEVARVRSEAVAGGSPRVVVLDAMPTAPPTSPPASANSSSTAPAGSKPTATAPTAVAPAASTKPVAAAPSPTGYVVQLAAPGNEKEANALRDRARGAGFSSFVQRVETADGTRFRVRLGPENDRAAAEKLLDAAAKKLGIAGFVARHP